MAANRRGLYTHQVFDHVALMSPITKFSAELNAERASQQVAKALDVALTEPRGPAFLNCPADATRAESGTTSRYDPGNGHLGTASPTALHSARTALAKAKKPLALIGLGALRPGVPEHVREFIDAWSLPFLTTFKAKGVVSEHQDLSLGALGLSPIVDDHTLKLIGEADHLTLVGFDAIELRDAWLDAWSPKLSCLTLDWSPQNDRVFPSGTQVLGDLGDNLILLSKDAKPAAAWPTKRLDAYRAAVQAIVAPREPEKGVSPATLFSTVSASLSDDVVCTVDVGAHRILACHAVKCTSPNQMLQSNGLCSMGYAIPAAVGAALAAPSKRIVAMLGDGSALMSLGELAVVAEHKLPVTIIVLNDDSLALIELKQSKMQVETGAVRFSSPGFSELARGFGLKTWRATTNAEFAAAYEAANAEDGPALIEAVCDRTEYWEQM